MCLLRPEAGCVWHATSGIGLTKGDALCHTVVALQSFPKASRRVCSGHQAESCNLSRQEGMNDENNRLRAGMKVQLKLSFFASEI